MVLHSILVKIMVYSELRTTLLLLVFDFLSVIFFMLLSNKRQTFINFHKNEKCVGNPNISENGGEGGSQFT